MRSLNKQPKNPGFIFSVFQTELSEKENVSNYNNTKNFLVAEKVSFKEVEGRYTYDNGTTVIELSFYVEINDVIEQHTLFDLVWSLSKNANQESFLQLDSNREATIVSLQGETFGIGVFTAVSEAEAKSSSAFTYCPKTQTYFTCK